MIRITLPKPYFRDDMVELIKPGSWILLKTRYCIFEFAHHILPLSNIPKRLLHIDLLLKITIQEDILHIQLKYWLLVVN